jgi:acyl-CoA synthetase (AMP-forming)/AMP-acid ligase II
MQNSPQFMAAFYAILRADAVVVPVNPMNLTEELRHYVHDSGARVAFVAQELLPRLQPLLREAAGILDHAIVATYSDYLEAPTDLPCPTSWQRAAPARLRARRRGLGRRAGRRAAARAARRPGPTTWRDALHLGHHRPPQGLHAHAPQRDVQRRGRHAVVWGQVNQGAVGLGGAADVPRHRHAVGA